MNLLSSLFCLHLAAYAQSVSSNNSQKGLDMAGKITINSSEFQIKFDEPSENTDQNRSLIKDIKIDIWTQLLLTSIEFEKEIPYHDIMNFRIQTLLFILKNQPGEDKLDLIYEPSFEHRLESDDSSEETVVAFQMFEKTIPKPLFSPPNEHTSIEKFNAQHSTNLLLKLFSFENQGVEHDQNKNILLSKAPKERRPEPFEQIFSFEIEGIRSSENGRQYNLAKFTFEIGKLKIPFELNGCSGVLVLHPEVGSRPNTALLKLQKEDKDEFEKIFSLLEGENESSEAFENRQENLAEEQRKMICSQRISELNSELMKVLDNECVKGPNLKEERFRKLNSLVKGERLESKIEEIVDLIEISEQYIGCLENNFSDEGG